MCTACGAVVGIIPEGQSAVRYVQGLRGAEFRPIANFEEAKKTPDAYVILEGDWGGQIYLVVPMSLVLCSEPTLRALLLELDRRQWNELEGVGLYFERHAVGDLIPGGMGGGRPLSGLWIHRALALRGLRRAIEEILGGTRDVSQLARPPRFLAGGRRKP